MVNSSKKEQREKLFQSFIDNELTDNEIEKELKSISKEYDISIDELKVEIIDDICKIVNNLYWELIETLVRPYLSQKEGTDSLINISKIASASEISFMVVNPLFVKSKNNDINIDTIRHIQNFLNASFAFRWSMYVVKSWDGLAKSFENNDKLGKILFYREDKDKNIWSIYEEHIAILSSINESNFLPLFTNASFWRLLCMVMLEMEFNSPK